MNNAVVMQTSEERLLLLAAAQFLGAVSGLPVAETPPDPQLDWARVVELANVHRLLPLLVRTPTGSLAPPAVRQELDGAARRLRVRAAVMAADFQALQARFAAAGIPLLPLKGLALAYRHYPSPSLRYHDDLNLLLPAAATGAALPLLLELGYIPHPNAPLPEWHHLAPHVHPQRGTLVELHHDLLRRAGPGWPLAEVWRRTVPITIDTCAAATLGDVDTLIYGVLHARHSLFQRLQALVDLMLVLQRVEDDRQAAALAAAAGAREALAFMLGAAESLFLPQAPALAPLFDRPLLRQGSRRRQQRMVRLVGWATLQPGRRSGHGPRARLLELRLLDSPGAVLRLAWRLLRPPRAFVEAGYSGGYAGRLWQRLRLLLGGH